MRNDFRPGVFLLVFMLMWCAVSGAAGESGAYRIEENPEINQTIYPYRVESDSVVIYLSREDVELLGEEAYYAGLDRLLENMEADLADARDELKDYLKEEVPPVRVYTAFSEHSKSQTIGAYYDSLSRMIKLFGDWDQSGRTLLHEYVHYLTFDCFRYGITSGFWAEGVAEYITKLVCRNRMARASNYGADEEDMAYYEAHRLADGEGNLDIRKYCYAAAAAWDTPGYIGVKYFPVYGRTMTMTASIQQHPKMDTLTYVQAACFMEYLVNRFGRDLVFTHLYYEPAKFRGLFGKSFEDLCNEWKQENLRKCTELGLDPEAIQ